MDLSLHATLLAENKRFRTLSVRVLLQAVFAYAVAAAEQQWRSEKLETAQARHVYGYFASQVIKLIQHVLSIVHPLDHLLQLVVAVLAAPLELLQLIFVFLNCFGQLLF